MADKKIAGLFALLIVFMALASLAGCGEPQSPNQVVDDFGTASGDGGSETGGGYAVVCGGQGNTASALHTTVCGGQDNTASVEHSTVSGGFHNTASASRATVSGGYGNSASHFDATIGGGSGNTASGTHATVSGGSRNTASGLDTTVSGGYRNTASGTHATVCGGSQNSATGFDATVAGGAGNTASDIYATASGGLSNQATATYATIGGGYANAASGSFSTVPGGFHNEAAGDYSFASGHRAHVDAAHHGTFLYADSNDFDFHSVAANEFAVRATGGIRLVTAIDSQGDSVAGVELVSGSGSWSSLSDRRVKANVSPVDEFQILMLLAEVPISTWNYVGQDPSIRHIGPMAQDFRAAFGLGEDNEHISTVDADGVALAAIQGLYQLMREKDAQIAALEARLAALEQADKDPSHPQDPSASSQAQ